MSILIKDTTKEERAKIVEESIGNIAGACDGCSVGIVENSDHRNYRRRHRCIFKGK